MKDTSAVRPFGATSDQRLWGPASRWTRRQTFAAPGRTLHLVDIENLMGGPLMGQVALRAAAQAYTQLAPVRYGDHVVVGANPKLLLEASAAWPGARLVMGGGPDGADKALLETVEDFEWTSRRYDRLVVGSGDHIFAVTIAAFRGAGIDVRIVARGGGLSVSMAALASSIAVIPAGKESLA